MPTSERVQRVQAVLAGRKPDRPPISFWYHFDDSQRFGPAAVRAHLGHLETYGLDFLKVMNDNAYPRPGEIRSIADLASLPRLKGDEPPFVAQLDLIASLARELDGEVLLSTTLFNAWATLRRIIRPKHRGSPPVMRAENDEASTILERFLAEDRGAVARALEIVGDALARFAGRCVEVGADGVFLSVRDDWVDTPANGAGTYRQLVEPIDLKILDAASTGGFNLLHVCGCAVDFRRFAGYPVQVINWADRSAGPAIREVCDWVEPAICGGLDNLETLPEGTPEQCAEQAVDAVSQAGDRPIMVAPGCTFDPERVPEANLRAVCEAVRA